MLYPKRRRVLILMNELQKLLPRHYRILDLVLDGNLTIKEIAEAVGMTQMGVHVIRRSPTFQHELAMRRKSREESYDETNVRDNLTALDLIHEKTAEAAEKIVDLMGSENESIALKSAVELLDRGGVPKETRSEQTNKTLVVTLSADDLDRIERTVMLDIEKKEEI